MRAVASAFAGAKNAVMAVEFVWSAAGVIISKIRQRLGALCAAGAGVGVNPGMERAPSTNCIF